MSLGERLQNREANDRTLRMGDKKKRKAKEKAKVNRRE